MEKKNQTGGFAVVAVIILASIGVGTIITNVVTCLLGGCDLTVIRSIIWTVASALFGLASYLIFGKDRLSFPVAIALHCVICLAITFAACRLCRFEYDGNSPLIEIIVIFVIVYAVVFCITYFASKAEAKKINDKIRAAEGRK